MEEIILRGFPHSEPFNPALIRWQERILIMYRVGWDTAELFLGELNRDYHPTGDFYKIAFPGTIGCEDARFFIHRNQLYFSCVAFYSGGRHGIGIGTVSDNLTVGDCHLIKGTDPLLNQKNWIFFSHDDQLYFTYAMSDGVHQVHRVTGDRCEPVYRTHYDDPWKWGIARGGTQLIHHEGLLYGFFHGTAYQYEELERRYFMGAYAIAPKPPFPIVKMSRTPLYTPPESRYHPPTKSRSGRMAANIFPSGLILERDSWRICAGYNNHAIKLFRIDHNELGSNLISTVPADQPVGVDTPHHYFNRRGRLVRVHCSDLDHYWKQPIELVQEHVEKGESVFADVRLMDHFPESSSHGELSEDRLKKGVNWVIFHKDGADLIELRVLDELKRKYKVVFANEVFVVFTNKHEPGMKTVFDPVHLQALWIKVEARHSVTGDKKLSLSRDVLARLNRFWTSMRKFFLNRYPAQHDHPKDSGRNSRLLF